MANPHGCYSYHLKTRALNSLQALGKAITCWFNPSSLFLHEGGGLGTLLFNDLAVDLANIQWDDGWSEYNFSLATCITGILHKDFGSDRPTGTGQGL